MATTEERLSALEARVDKLDGGVQPPVVAPPANVKAVFDAATKRTKLTWDAVDGATTYEVWGASNGAALQKLGSQTARERLSGTMTVGQRLDYAVLTVKGTEKSALSPTVSAMYTADTTPPPDPTPTPTPTGAIPWEPKFPDGRAYNPPAPTKTVSYTGQSLAGLKDTKVTGIKLAKGATLEVNGATNCIFEIEMKYQQAGDIVKFRGTTRRVGVYNSVFGPDTEAAPGFTETCQYLYFGDNVEDIYVSNTTFQNKSSAGNALRVYGTFEVAGAKGGGRYGVYSNCLFRNIRPFDENDHEGARVGVSTMQATDGQHVFEFCRFENVASEPEVVSMKMWHEVVRGCTFVNCAGGPVMRHGNESAIHDNYMIGDIAVTSAASTTVRTSGGIRGYGRGHKVFRNTIRVNGTSKYERPILLDYGDASPDGIGNGHANVENWDVYENLLVKCGAPIVVGKNYGTAPKGSKIRNNWVVECAGGDDQGVLYVAPLGADCSVTANKKFAKVADAGLTLDANGVYRAPNGEVGSRAPFITASMVGKGSNWNPRTGGTVTPDPIVVTPDPVPGGGGTGTPSFPPGVKYPADITGPNWKVTLPTSTDGKVTEVKPPAYGTFKDDKYFFLNAEKNGVVCKVWHGGDTTQNSKNPRTELRERFNNDPEGYWDASKGTHTMEVVGQVNRLTKVKPHTVIAQIHDAADDTSVWRVEGNKLYLTNGNTAHGYLVDGEFQLGKKYTLKYVVTNGKYEYYYNGAKVPFSLNFTSPSYFKAGAYLQSNPSTVPDESTSEYTEVVIYSVKVTHA